jgi:myo-inositol catabolism protein IolC
MRANRLSAEQAAEDMDLPVEQVVESLAYYHTHHELIESEMEEEKQYLQT